MVNWRGRPVAGAQWLLGALVVGMVVSCSSGSGNKKTPSACPTGTTLCGGQCSNPQGDGNNCGDCGIVCQTGQVCSAGVCSATGCPGDQLQCDTSCVTAASDPLNCGACGKICSGGATCEGGACVSGSSGAGGTGGSGGASGSAGAAGSGGTSVNAACPGDATKAYQGTPGTLPGTVEAETFDPAGYSDSSTGNEGGAFRTDVDVDIKAAGDGYALGWMTAGEWLEYTVNVPTAGDYTLTVQAGAVDAGRTLEFSSCGTVLATVTAPQVAAWGELATSNAVAMHLEAGLQVIRVTVGANDYLDFDSFTLQPGNPGTGGTGGTGGAGGAGGSSGSSGTGGSGDATPSQGCGSPPTTLQSAVFGQSSPVNSVSVGGMDRQFLVRWPSNYKNDRPYRLHLGLHGYGGNLDENGKDNFGLWNLSQDSTIFVTLAAVGGAWNLSGDLTYVDEVLKKVEDELCIDTSRVMLEGFSQGGAMSWSLTCARPGVFRAVVGHSAGSPGYSAPTNCAPVAYFGTLGLGDIAGNSQATQTDPFARDNSCTIENLPTAPTGGHVCTPYRNCQQGFPVVWCSYDGGHWFQQVDAGQTVNWIPEAVWSFLSPL